MFHGIDGCAPNHSFDTHPSTISVCRGPCGLSGLVRYLRLIGRVGLGVDPGLLALLGRDRGGRLGQRVEATTGLGEGDDVADGVGPGQQGDDAVPAEGDATVRRSTELDGFRLDSMR